MNSSGDTPLKEKVAAWLQVLRVPNLLTVPGDPIAGMFLAVDPGLGSIPPGRAALVAGASLLLYAAGLAGNDVMDIDEDRRERPGRPLPRGIVSVRSAAVAAVALAVAGVALAAWAGPRTGTMALVLAASVVFYDTRGKRIAWLGPLNMALCRALSLLMGVALAADAVGTPRGLPLTAASALFVYIALVSVVARDETSPGEAGWKRWLPPVGMACGFASVSLFLAVWIRCVDPFVWAPGAVAAAGALAACALASRGAAAGRVPRAVGVWILCLVPMQSAWCLWSGHTAGLWAGAVLLLAWPAAMLLAKRFHAS